MLLLLPLPLALARVLLALIAALVLPRVRAAVLLGFALLLLLGAGGLAILQTSPALGLFAALAFASLFAATLLVRALPRVFIALFAIAALPMASALDQSRLGLIAAAVGLLVALALAVRRPELLFRLSCASLGALALVPLLPPEHPLAGRCLLALLLFFIESRMRRAVGDRELAPLPMRTQAKLGAALGAVAAIAIFLLPLLAQPLGTPIASDRPDLTPIDCAGRRAALSAQAPQGGLVWPLPSEAISWDEPNLDRALFPFFDNLDALHLGVRTRALVVNWGDRNVAASGSQPPRRAAWLSWLLLRMSLHPQLARLRLVQDAGALARLDAAANATVAALRDVLPMIHAGTPEASIEEALKRAMRARGCGPESFPLILASGPSAAEPHGSGNQGALRDGELLVADIGCSVDHYASDFTRTLPVSGQFSARQRLLYDNVLAAQAAALAQCRVGAVLDRGGAHGASLEEVARGVLKARAPDGEAHMPHSLGHSVGLFVHDIYTSAKLEAGNVITLEPGTYLQGELGIRIEDTFAVTASGCERVTQGFPAEAEAVEAVLRGAQGLPNSAQGSPSGAGQ